MLKKLLTALKPLKYKLFAENIIKSMIFGFSTVAFFSALFFWLSKFAYIRYFSFYISSLFILGFVFSLIYSIIKIPGGFELMKIGDSLGFSERFVTAFEILQNEDNAAASKISELVVIDAIEKAEQADFKKLYRLNISKKILIVALLIFSFSLLSAFIPAPDFAKNNLAILAEHRVVVEKIISEIEKVERNLTTTISEKNSKEIREIISESKKELKKSTTKAETAKIMQKTQEKIQKLSNSADKSDIKALSDFSADTPNAPDISALIDAVKNNDLEKAKEILQEFNNALESLSNEERGELSQSYTELASELIGSLALSLSQLSDDLAVKSDNPADNFFEALESKIIELGKLVETIDDLNDKISKAAGQNNPQSAMPQGNPQSGDPQSGNPQSGDLTTGFPNNPTSTQVSTRGKGHVPNESIYSRPAKNLIDFSTKITGVESEKGEITAKTAKGFADTGEILPYQEVFNSYKEEALNSLDNSEIPFGMQELIKEYFSSLE